MGVNAVLYYGPSIFERAGWSGSDSLFAQILVGAVNMLTTVLALAIIDRVGRKKLVYWGVSGMVLSLLLIGTCFLTGERSGMPDGVLLAAFLCCIFCCAISVCAVVWVLLSEMYPIRVRGVAMSIAGFALWVGTHRGRAAYAVDAREPDAGGDLFPLCRDVRALYAADMEGGAGDVGPHARRDRTILDKITI